jgi:hypothetical protein
MEKDVTSVYGNTGTLWGNSQSQGGGRGECVRIHRYTMSKQLGQRGGCGECVPGSKAVGTSLEAAGTGPRMKLRSGNEQPQSRSSRGARIIRRGSRVLEERASARRTNHSNIHRGPSGDVV